MQSRQDLGKAIWARSRTLPGFTLVELMVTVTIMAILLSFGVPAYQDAVLSNKLGGYANALVASSLLARGEAIKRNAQVTMCVSTNGTTCATGGWEQGWIVLAGTTVIHRQAALGTGFRGNGSATNVIFQPTGMGATQTSVTFCRATPSVGDQERVVSISATGRPSVSKTSAGSCS